MIFHAPLYLMLICHHQQLFLVLDRGVFVENCHALEVVPYKYCDDNAPWANSYKINRKCVHRPMFLMPGLSLSYFLRVADILRIFLSVNMILTYDNIIRILVFKLLSLLYNGQER